MTKIIEPTGAPPHQCTRGEAVPIGPHLVRFKEGVVCIDDAPGVTTTMVERDGMPPSIGLIVYDPGPGDEGHGIGFIAQLPATIAREIAASLIRLAGKLDGGKLS